MQRLHSWRWIEEQVARSTETWSGIPGESAPDEPVFTVQEQQRREAAYDDALAAVEKDARRAARTRAQRLDIQRRVIDSFGRFAGLALGLEEDAVELLTGRFLPIGAQFAQWSRRFDPAICHEDITQACRNAWTACGLQPLLGEPMGLTPSIVGYSLLYPYSDNYLDSSEVSAREKRLFSQRFLARLRGEALPPLNPRESAIWNLVALVETQFPRAQFPQVFDCMIAIHRAQEESIAQLKGNVDCDLEILPITSAKGGSSVLADACLSRGWLNGEESEFAFDWGMLLQLGDDLQDVREDLRRGSATLFSRNAAAGRPLDSLTARLLEMSGTVSDRMDRLPHGSPVLKGLLRMSWRQLIVMAVANVQEFFTPQFAAEMERRSPFRFAFLRARQKRLEGRQGLYSNLFDAFLEPGQDAVDKIPYNLNRIAPANI
jgi:hypothetical protein